MQLTSVSTGKRKREESAGEKEYKNLTSQEPPGDWSGTRYTAHGTRQGSNPCPKEACLLVLSGEGSETTGWE